MRGDVHSHDLYFLMSSQVLRPWFQDLSSDVLCVLGKLSGQLCFAPCVSIEVDVSARVDIFSI